MEKRVDTGGARSITDIAPLIASDGKRVEFGWQRDQSEKALLDCRAPRVLEWLSASLPLGIFYGVFLCVVAVIATISHYGGMNSSESETACRFAAVSSSALALVSCAVLYRFARRRAYRKACAACGPDEQEWHARYLRIHPKVLSFDNRLNALQRFSQNADEGQDIDEEVVGKYTEERASLDRELRTLYRERALRQFEKAVDASNDGSYRGTRDVTDLLFVHRARHEDADREIATLTAIDEPSHIRVTGTIPVSQPPANDEAADDGEEEESRPPDTLRSQRIRA